MRDTTPEATRRYYALLAERTPAQRLQIASRLTRAVRGLAETAIRSQNPGATEDEIRRRLTERLYGSEVAERLFGKEQSVARSAR